MAIDVKTLPCISMFFFVELGKRIQIHDPYQAVRRRNHFPLSTTPNDVLTRFQADCQKNIAHVGRKSHDQCDSCAPLRIPSAGWPILRKTDRLPVEANGTCPSGGLRPIQRICPFPEKPHLVWSSPSPEETGEGVQTPENKRHQSGDATLPEPRRHDDGSITPEKRIEPSVRRGTGRSNNGAHAHVYRISKQDPQL